MNYFRSCVGLVKVVFSVVRFQSLKWSVKKSQNIWNKNFMPWKLLERYLFTRHDAAKKSLLRCAHSLGFLMYRNSWITIIRVHFSWSNLYLLYCPLHFLRRAFLHGSLCNFLKTVRDKDNSTCFAPVSHSRLIGKSLLQTQLLSYKEKVTCPLNQRVNCNSEWVRITSLSLWTCY